jgi:hypothetical protein
MRYLYPLCGYVCVLLLAARGQGDDEGYRLFGGQRMESPKNFHLPDASLQASYAYGWKPDPGARRRIGAAWPFRDSVELGLGGLGHMVLLRDKGVFDRPCWDSIGYFLAQIENARQFEAALSLLDPRWAERRLSVRQLARIISAVQLPENKGDFKVLAQAAPESLAACVTLREGIWYSDFALIEGSMVNEYKYAIDRDKHVGRVFRRLVEGPRVDDWRVGLGESTLYDWLPEETKKQYERCLRCGEVLEKAAGPRDDKPAVTEPRRAPK